jgi:hypothetical protein
MERGSDQIKSVPVMVGKRIESDFEGIYPCFIRVSSVAQDRPSEKVRVRRHTHHGFEVSGRSPTHVREGSEQVGVQWTDNRHTHQHALIQYQNQRGRNTEDDPVEEGPARPMSLAPRAVPRSPMIVIIDRPLKPRWFPFSAARATPRAATMSARLQIVQRGGCIVILRWGISASYASPRRGSTTCPGEEVQVPRPHSCGDTAGWSPPRKPGESDPTPAACWMSRGTRFTIVG